MFRFAAKYPGDIPEEDRLAFQEEADRVFAPVSDALLGRQPLLIELRKLIQEIEFLQVD